jgi:uncharacterized membrane protein YgcG
MIPSHRRAVLRTTGAGLSAVAVALAVLSWPAGATAQESEELAFDYAVDGVAWFWSHQIDETLELGTVVQPVELPNPQAESTLPVAVEFGDAAKVAALRFNLAERGVPQGATITEFVLTIAEGDDAGDMPTFNPARHGVQACPITEAWSSGDAEMWDVQPAAGEQCVAGERTEPTPEELADAEDAESIAVPLPKWTFDLTEIAADWAEDHFQNHGVMFTPVLDDATPVDLWQVNLKLPLRNDPQTEIDEYELTADRLSAVLSYDPPLEEDADEDTEEVTEDTSTGGSPGGASGGSGGGGSGGGSSGGGSAGDDAAAGDADEVIEPAAHSPIEPAMPWYVWLLIPGALAAAYAVHTALGGPGMATSGGGAIDRIRAHNLDRRGFALPLPAGLWERLTGRGAGVRG